MHQLFTAKKLMHLVNHGMKLGNHCCKNIWTKFLYGGDFCVEMYAGMRHGWYERAGDLNLTVFNEKNTPSQGYTITTTGWDPDHSQLWTTLYRNGR